MRKCKNADKYRGKIAPTCNDKNPCDTCKKRHKIYQIASKMYTEKDIIEESSDIYNEKVGRIILEHRRSNFVKNVEFFLEKVE